MSVNFKTVYGTLAGGPSAEYPLGFGINETIPGAGDGSPFEEVWFNDWMGLFQKLLTEAGITPSGNPDTVLASDYYDALVYVISLAKKKQRTVSSSGAILASDKIVFADATAGDVDLTPPSAPSMVVGDNTAAITIKRIDTSLNKVSVSGIEGETINLTGDGMPFIKIASDGTTIYLVG